MSVRAKAAWKRLSALLARIGVLTEVDGFALERLCGCYDEILEYRKQVDAHGPVYVTTSTAGDQTPRANPAVAMMADADRRFRAWLIEFGLTPAARGKVHRIGGDVDDEPDPLDEFFG